MSIPTPFHRRLADARHNADLTQRDVSIRSGIPPTQISNFENNLRAPNLKNLIRLRNAIGCTWEALLGE